MMTRFGNMLIVGMRNRPVVSNSFRSNLIPLIEPLKAASTAPKVCTAKSKRDYIGVHSYPIKLIRYECTPIWPLSLSGVHSDMVPYASKSALPFGPHHFLKMHSEVVHSISKCLVYFEKKNNMYVPYDMGFD